jgi:hypothetical protein
MRKKVNIKVKNLHSIKSTQIKSKTVSYKGLIIKVSDLLAIKSELIIKGKMISYKLVIKVKKTHFLQKANK